MALLFTLPRVSTIDLVGEGAPRAQLYFYQTGSSTPQPVYADSGLTTALLQPVTASDAGLFAAIYLNDELSHYKIVCQDENGAVLWTVDPYLVGPTQGQIGRTLYPRTTAEQSAGVTPTYYYYEPGDVRRYGYIADGVDGTNTGTNNTTALQNCVTCNAVTVLPEGVGMFTNINLPVGHTIEGCGERITTLRQFSTATGSAITFADANSPDISHGAFKLRNFCMKVADGSHGIAIGEINGSMLEFTNFRMWAQHEETLTSAPYTTVSNQRGIYVQSGATGSNFLASFRTVELRSFDVGIDASGTIGANEWTFTTTWILGSRVGIRLSNSSTWNMSGVTIESGVSNGRALQTFNSVSNITWIGGRWEITEPNGYGIEADGSTTGSNWRFSGINVLINGDGSGIPGRKWTGTIPTDFVFEGTDSNGPFLIVPTSSQAMRFPARMLIGGQGLGDGRITLGRDLGGSEGTIENAAAGHTIITGGNSVKLRGGGAATDLFEVDGTRAIVHGADGATGYTAAMRLGANSYLWVDSTGDLRIKQGAPTGDTDGTVVGTQS
jgi:hypothetical protein